MERPAVMVPRSLGEVLMENKIARTYFRAADLKQWVQVKVVLGAGMPEKDGKHVEKRFGWIRTTGCGC